MNFIPAGQFRSTWIAPKIAHSATLSDVFRSDDTPELKMRQCIEILSDFTHSYSSQPKYFEICAKLNRVFLV